MFEQTGGDVVTDMRAYLTMIALLASATPAAAQYPSFQAGDWLRVDVRARFQGDIRRSEAPLEDDHEGAGLDIARRRVGVEGVVARKLEYQIEYELGEGLWRDVYLNYRPSKALQVQAGTFKIPFGLEETTSSTKLDLVYRSRISSRLAPGRDTGVTVHGRILDGFVSYEAGLFRHDGENARPSHSDRVFGDETWAFRGVVFPFRHSASTLGDLQLGAAISRTNVGLGFSAVRARTVFGASFFDSDLWVKGRRQRTGIEARWRLRRLSLQSEYIRLTDERRGQAVDDGDLSPLFAHGWYVSGTYRITPRKSRFGYLEAAARQEWVSFGSTSKASDFSTSERADAVVGNADRITTLGVNWHVNRWVKVQANVIREMLEHPSMGPLPGSPGFWSQVFRLQLTM
jgi:phosphate-selective porin